MKKQKSETDLRRIMLLCWTGNYVSSWTKIKGKEYVEHTIKMAEAKRFSLIEADAILRKYDAWKPVELIEPPCQ